MDITKINETNSRVFEIFNVETEGTAGDDNIKLIFRAIDSGKILLNLDNIACNTIRIAFKSLCDAGRKILPYMPRGVAACYYRCMYVNSLEMPSSICEGIIPSEMRVINPAFMKIPARTTNEARGHFIDIDDDGLIIFAPRDEDGITLVEHKVWIAFSTKYALQNSYDESIKYIVLSFDYYPTSVMDMVAQTHMAFWQVIDKIGKLFPINRFDSFNGSCAGYMIHNYQIVEV